MANIIFVAKETGFSVRLSFQEKDGGRRRANEGENGFKEKVWRKFDIMEQCKLEREGMTDGRLSKGKSETFSESSILNHLWID